VAATKKDYCFALTRFRKRILKSLLSVFGSKKIARLKPASQRAKNLEAKTLFS
jgi:hypothetical protein